MESILWTYAYIDLSDVQIVWRLNWIHFISQLNSFHILQPRSVSRPKVCTHSRSHWRAELDFYPPLNQICAPCTSVQPMDWLQDKLQNILSCFWFMILFEGTFEVTPMSTPCIRCGYCDVESDTSMKRSPSSQTNEVRAKRNLQSWDDAWDGSFPEGLCQVGNVI